MGARANGTACLKIASWNVNSLNVRLPHLQQWLREAQPDVVALQETKLEDERFPDAALAELGYRSVFCGQKTYNGVALLSRVPFAQRVHHRDPGLRRPAEARARRHRRRRAHRRPVRGQRRGGGQREVRVQAALARRRARMAARGTASRIRTWWCSATSTSRPTTATCTTRSAGARRSCAPRPSARRCSALLDLGLHDSFRLLHDDGGHFSWWDYRLAAFQRGWGLRIDLVLVSEALRARCTRRRHRHARRAPGSGPSDHTPVWVRDCD